MFSPEIIKSSLSSDSLFGILGGFRGQILDKSVLKLHSPAILPNLDLQIVQDGNLDVAHKLMQSHESEIEAPFVSPE